MFSTAIRGGKAFAAEIGMYEALFTDLSKAFDCLVHDFLPAKLEAYGFSYESLKLINSYLTDTKHNIERK